MICDNELLFTLYNDVSHATPLFSRYVTHYDTRIYSQPWVLVDLFKDFIFQLCSGYIYFYGIQNVPKLSYQSQNLIETKSLKMK